jgi:hypothetical protein
VKRSVDDAVRAASAAPGRGVNALPRARRGVRAASDRIRLGGVDGPVLSTMRVVGLQQVLPFSASVQLALPARALRSVLAAGLRARRIRDPSRRRRQKMGDGRPLPDEGTPMDQPTQAVPEAEPAARSYDPPAVALANASLLGAGYLMLGQRRLAVVTGLVTLVLLVLLASARSVWFEVVVLFWWAALVAHGWFLAGGRTRGVAVRGQRLVALGVTVPVLLIAGLLRFDASSIEGTVAEARHSGDCAQAVTAQHRVWLGPRLADAPLTARGDRTVQACRRLATVKDQLTTGLTGDTDALKAGFDGLSSVLTDLPGHEKMVEVVLDGFLGGLPAKNPCATVEVTDWLRRRQATHNALDRSAGAVARTAPAALLGCGDTLMAAQDWAKARTGYQQLLDQYPGYEGTGKARDGVRQATLAIELANVRGLLDGPASTQPEYCSKPAKYSGAAPYGRGTSRALFYGNDEYTSKLPAAWRATDAARAVLVVCVGDKEFGDFVQTCPYESKLLTGFPTNVTFRKIAIPVKAYELRTGKLVVDTKVQVDGTSCPKTLEYTSYGLTDLGPPSEVYVTTSNADIRAGLRSLITR